MAFCALSEAKGMDIKMKKRLLKYIPTIISAPAIIIGAVTMYMNNVPTSIYIQNILCLIILGLISYFVISKEYSFNKDITIILTILSLLLTFINPGIEGVHRWVSIGPIRLYVSSIVLPIIIINLWKIIDKKNNSIWISMISVICISIILALQPDASMITAFAIPMIILFWNSNIKNIFRIFIIIFLSILTTFSWIFLDELAPVSYVEGIIELVKNMGILWFILGIITLIILPLPFILFPIKEYKLLSLCIGIYFFILLVSTIFGNFPVPLMGYGISPIIGYFISITWFAKAKIISIH